MKRHSLLGASLLIISVLACALLGVGRAHAMYGGSTTVGAYDPANSRFYLRNSNTPGPADTAINYGNPNWTPIAGDWDGDGKVTVGIYDPTTAWFHLRNSNTTGPGEINFQYGNFGWIPIAGDWNGDGKDTIGLYDPDTITFYLRDSNSAGAADHTFIYGNLQEKPLAGDWNNDRITSVASYANQYSNFTIGNEFCNTGYPGCTNKTFTVNYGNSGWTPISGDWDSNGYWSIGMYDPTGAVFYLKNLNASGAADITVQYGNSGWEPVVGDWDGR